MESRLELKIEGRRVIVVLFLFIFRFLNFEGGRKYGVMVLGGVEGGSIRIIDFFLGFLFFDVGGLRLKYCGGLDLD